MHREKPNKFVHALVESAIIFGKGGQIVLDLGLLFGGFLKQALCHHEFDIASGNENLLKSILHPADAVGDKGKTRAVENGFLDTGHETEAQILADLANLSKEV